MINLLPPQQKQLLLQEERFREVLILGTIIIFSLFAFGFILFFIKFDLRNKVLDQREILLEKKTEFEASEIKDLEKEIESLNKTLSELTPLYQEKSYLTDVTEALSQTVPSGLYFTNLSFNKEKNEFSLSGFSPTREKLIEFKKNLEQNGNFKEIYFPPSNWIEPINIDFSANVKIKK